MNIGYLMVIKEIERINAWVKAEVGDEHELEDFLWSVAYDNSEEVWRDLKEILWNEADNYVKCNKEV